MNNNNNNSSQHLDKKPDSYYELQDQAASLKYL